MSKSNTRTIAQKAKAGVPAWRILEAERNKLERRAFAAVRAGNEALGRAYYTEAQKLRPERGVRPASDVVNELRRSRWKAPSEAAIRREQRTSALFRQQWRLTSGMTKKQKQAIDLRKRGFYAATVQIWNGDYTSDRDQAILDHFYPIGSTNADAEAFREWLSKKGYSKTVRNLFAVEEYIRETNATEYAEAYRTGDYPNPAFQRLTTFG